MNLSPKFCFVKRYLIKKYPRNIQEKNSGYTVDVNFLICLNLNFLTLQSRQKQFQQILPFLRDQINFGGFLQILQELAVLQDFN
jgi:hypothetical protein